MENFDLAIIYTVEGVLVAAALVKVIVSAVKNLGIIPETGRAPMLAALAVSAALVGLSLIDADFLRDGTSGNDILKIVLAVVGLYTASIGVHETAAKVQRIAESRTNPTGPDR